MSQTSNRFVLAFGLAVLVLEFFLSQQSALATDKISLFKVITTKDEIVIGLTDDELSKIDGRNAGGVAKMLAAKGAMTVWQYAVRKAETGALEQAPLRKIGLMANASLRVEPYTSPLKIVPVSN
jgi:hypothetical protein